MGIPPYFASRKLRSTAFVCRPVRGMRQHAIGDHIILRGGPHISYKLVGLGSVACPMRQLHIFNVTGMTATGHWYDMVNTSRQRVRIPHSKINRSSANSASALRRVDLLFVSFKRQAVGTVFIRSVSLLCHISPLTPLGYKKAARDSVSPGRLVYFLPLYYTTACQIFLPVFLPTLQRIFSCFAI